MEVVWFLILGACAGWLAGSFFKGSGFGLIGNIIVGVIGAVLGGLAFDLLGLQTTSLLGQLVTATVGAILLLFLLAKFGKKK